MQKGLENFGFEKEKKKEIKRDLGKDKFILDGVLVLNANISLTTAGSKIIFINYSNQGNILSRIGYLNFTITAFDLDQGNKFDFTDNFTNDFNINVTALNNITAPMSVLDDFENNATASRYTFGGTEPPEFTLGFLDMSSQNTDSEITFDYVSLDNVSRFNFSSRYCDGHTCGADCGGSVSQSIFLTDLTTDVTLFSRSDGFSQPSQPCNFENQNITGERVGDRWTIFRNGVEVGTRSIGSLNSPHYLKLRTSSSGTGGSSGQTKWHIFDLKTSGIRLQRINGTYDHDVKTNATFESNNLTDTTNPISRVFLTVSEFKPSETTINYFASNDGGKTYETVTPGTFHTFTSTGSKLKIKFLFNSTSNITTPYISNYRVQIIPSSPNELTIDVGNDGIIDMKVFGELNSTNTPINYNGTDNGIRDYINRSCRTGSFCVIPVLVVLGSGGTTQLSEFNLTQNINPIRLNISRIQKLNVIPIELTYLDGKVQLNDVEFDFRGSKNITVVAHIGDYSTSLNRTIFVKYSPFNVTYWSSWHHWYIRPKSANESGLEPAGQNSSHGIWKVVSFAYDGNISVWARYNESIDTCVTQMELRGQNFSVSTNNSLSTLNITNLTTFNQQIISDQNSTLEGSIRTITMINCSADTGRFILRDTCFNSRCSECTETQDFQDSCDVII